MRHSPGEARLLGLWTAGCLTVLLLVGIVWVGDIALQWPVFVVPLVWAAVAMRPRRGAVRREARPDVGPDVRWDEPPAGDGGYPATREAPTMPPPPPRPYRREW